MLHDNIIYLQKRLQKPRTDETGVNAVCRQLEPCSHMLSKVIFSCRQLWTCLLTSMCHHVTQISSFQLQHTVPSYSKQSNTAPKQKWIQTHTSLHASHVHYWTISSLLEQYKTLPKTVLPHVKHKEYLDLLTFFCNGFFSICLIRLVQNFFMFYKTILSISISIISVLFESFCSCTLWHIKLAACLTLVYRTPLTDVGNESIYDNKLQTYIYTESNTRNIAATATSFQ